VGYEQLGEGPTWRLNAEIEAIARQTYRLDGA
jgi:hypothetical protein